MALDDLYKAFDIFKQNVNELSFQRTISQANDAVYQIKNSELKEDEKVNNLRNVAQQLTFTLASQGVPATTLQTLAGQIAPAQRDPQNAEQAILFGNQSQSEKANQFLNDKERRALELQQAKLDGMLQSAKVKADNKSNLTDFQLGKLGEGFDKFVQADASVRNALGQASLNKQRADNLRTLVGDDLTEEGLSKLPPQQLGELAIGMATLVKNGVASEGEVKMIFPKTASMDKAQTVSYLSGGPQPSNVPEFAKLYLKTIQREGAQAQSQIEDSVLKRATGSQYVKLAPDEARTKIAAQLNIDPSEVLIDGAKVTTVKKQQEDDKFASYSSGINDLVSKAKAGDNSSASQLKKLGIDLSMPKPQLDQEIRHRIRSGSW